MLKLRVLTAAVVLPLFLAAMFLLPNAWWGAVLILPLLIAGHEWGRLSGFDARQRVAFLVSLFASCTALWAIAAFGLMHGIDTLSGVDRCVYTISIAFWCFIAPCCLWYKIAIVHPLCRALAGLVVLVPTWLALARLQNSPKMLLALLLVVWIADSAAYFSGRAWGKHKLAPEISPGKTWEGVGGAFAAVTVYAISIHAYLFPTYGMTVIVAAFLGIACISIVGDLYESWIKRGAGVKDSGTVLPGHGGILDRIDAITSAMPLATLIFI